MGRSRYCLGSTVGSSVSEDDEVELTYELAPRISSVLPTTIMNICRFNGQSRAACIMPANTCLSGDNAPTFYPAAVASSNSHRPRSPLAALLRLFHLLYLTLQFRTKRNMSLPPPTCHAPAPYTPPTAPATAPATADISFPRRQKPIQLTTISAS